MIVIIDYDAGNTRSVMNALDRLGADYLLSHDQDQIKRADKIIFPGVGHAGAAMDALKKKKLVDTIKSLSQPVLGICVGMQLLAEASEEGETECLGIAPGTVKKFDDQQVEKVPHMGWNEIQKPKEDVLFTSVNEGSHLYFVHSYYLPSSELDIATCDYQVSFAAAIKIDNFWGVQFHPEKSGKIGAKIIDNFLNENLEI